MTLLSFERRNGRAIESGSICQSISDAAHDYSVESVRNTEQLRQACRLLYNSYRRCGYCEENERRLYFSPHMLDEFSRTFVLKDVRSVLGTISVFPDNGHGIPLDTLYPTEITRLREGGVRFAEVGLLATDSMAWTMDSDFLASKEKMLPVFLLFKIGINYALFSAISHLVIAIHPKHRMLYEILGFRQFADEKSYEIVCGNPAVPMMQDLREEVRKASPSLKNFFLASPFSSEHFNRSIHRGSDPYAELLGTDVEGDVNPEAR